MVNGINPQFNNIAMQAGVPMQAGLTTPVLTDADREKLKQSVDKSYLANRVKASESSDQNEMLAKVAAGTAIWYGISQGMDKLNPMCAGDFDKSFLGKIGAFGDRVHTGFNNTSLGRGFNNVMNSLKTRWTGITEKNNLAYAITNHSTQPEWKFAKGPGAGVKGFFSMDLDQVFEEFLEPISDVKRSNMPLVYAGKMNAFQRLEQFGYSQAQIDAFRDSLKGQTFAQKALALQKKELELLTLPNGKKLTAKQIETIASKKGLEGLRHAAKTIKVRMIGFDNLAHYAKLEGNSLEHMDEIYKVLEKGVAKNPNLKVSIWRPSGFGGKLLSHLFGRQVSISEYFNKTKVMLGMGRTTALGRALPKAMSWLLEGCTNRFAGGKLAVAMQAAIFADMAINTFKAPKGEKGKTFAERFVNDFTYFMAMPLGIWAMHKVGGLKYAGLDKAGVEAYRTQLKAFNETIKAGGLANKTEYTAAKKALNNMLKADVKNPITKLCKAIGKFINIGNETKLAYRSTAKYNMNFFRKFGNFFRNVAGVPMRFAIPLAIISPFVAKAVTKGVHAIVGKPTKSVLDEDKEEAQAQPVQAQAPAQPQTTANNPFSSNDANTNLINNYIKNQAVPQPQSAPNQIVQPYTVQQPNPLAQTKPITTQQVQSQPIVKEPAKKRYIPSPYNNVPPNAQSSDSQADAAMKRFDMAEKMAMDTLQMR